MGEEQTDSDRWFFSVAHLRGRGEKANTPPFDNFFLNFFKKHKQRGDPLELFYGPSFQIELDAPLGSGVCFAFFLLLPSAFPARFYRKFFDWLGKTRPHPGPRPPKEMLFLKFFFEIELSEKTVSPRAPKSGRVRKSGPPTGLNTPLEAFPPVLYIPNVLNCWPWTSVSGWARRIRGAPSGRDGSDRSPVQKGEGPKMGNTLHSTVNRVGGGIGKKPEQTQKNVLDGKKACRSAINQAHEPSRAGKCNQKKYFFFFVNFCFVFGRVSKETREKRTQWNVDCESGRKRKTGGKEENCFFPVMSSHFSHPLKNYTRRAIFPKMCKINQSSVDFHCKPL